MDPMLRAGQSRQSRDLAFRGCYALTLEILVCVDWNLGLFFFFFLTSVLCSIPGAGHAEKVSTEREHLPVHSFKCVSSTYCVSGSHAGHWDMAVGKAGSFLLPSRNPESGVGDRHRYRQW